MKLGVAGAVLDGALLVLIVVVLLEIEASALVDHFCPTRRG